MPKNELVNDSAATSASHDQLIADKSLALERARAEKQEALSGQEEMEATLRAHRSELEFMKAEAILKVSRDHDEQLSLIGGRACRVK